MIVVTNMGIRDGELFQLWPRELHRKAFGPHWLRVIAERASKEKIEDAEPGHAAEYGYIGGADGSLWFPIQRQFTETWPILPGELLKGRVFNGEFKLLHEAVELWNEDFEEGSLRRIFPRRRTKLVETVLEREDVGEVHANALHDQIFRLVQISEAGEMPDVTV